MNVIARKSLIYGGRRIAAGEEFTARRQDGRVLIAIGKAHPKQDDVVQLQSLPKAMTASNEPADVKPKRQYKTRAMKAETIKGGA